MVGDLPDWFKTFDCAHEYGIDPEVMMQKSIFFRDRMLLTVHAKREAENKSRKMMEDMMNQLEGRV
jgi:hypothetical protein